METSKVLVRTLELSQRAYRQPPVFGKSLLAISLVQADIPLSTSGGFEGLSEATGDVTAYYTFKKNTGSVVTAE